MCQLCVGIPILFLRVGKKTKSFSLIVFLSFILKPLFLSFSMSLSLFRLVGNGRPAAAGRALLGFDFVFVFSFFSFLSLALDHIPRLAGCRLVNCRAIHF